MELWQNQRVGREGTFCQVSKRFCVFSNVKFILNCLVVLWFIRNKRCTGHLPDPNLVLYRAMWKGFCMDLVILQLICLMSSVLIIFYLETKVKILAERDRASAEAAFKALDTSADGR